MRRKAEGLSPTVSGRVSAPLRAVRDVTGLVWQGATRYVKVRLVAVLCLLVGGSALTALAPVALKRAVDALAYSGRAAPASALGWIGLYVAGQGLARSLGQIRGLVYARAERRMLRSLSERLFAHVMSLPLRFHLDRRTGAIGQTLDNGLQGYRLFLQQATFTMVPSAVELGTVIAVFVATRQPGLVALFALAIASYAAAFGVFAARIAPAARAASAARVDASAAMTDAILSYETVKLFCAEPAMQERVSGALLRTEREWVGFYRRYACNGLGATALFALFLAATLLYATRQVQRHRMTVGDFVLVSTYLLQVVRPIEMLGYAMQGLSQGLAMLGKLLELYREPPEGRREGQAARVAAGARESVVSGVAAVAGGAGVAGDAADGVSNSVSNDVSNGAAGDATGGAPHSGPSSRYGELEFAHVDFSYGADRALLADLSFRLPAGGTLGIVGASGAGKSTLVRLLVRLLEPGAGGIRLDGVGIGDLPLAELRGMIAVVPQDTALLDDTIGYNIALGRPGSTVREVQRAARLARLHDWVMSLPEAYGTRVGERGMRLSGGERQRISIARAALRRARIYVLDEATSSLDSATEREILASFREIAGYRSTLIIAHRLSTVTHADEILVLDGGRVAERGSHGGLLALGGRYAALWHAQSDAGAATDGCGAGAGHGGAAGARAGAAGRRSGADAGPPTPDSTAAGRAAARRC